MKKLVGPFNVPAPEDPVFFLPLWHVTRDAVLVNNIFSICFWSLTVLLQTGPAGFSKHD